MRCRLAGRGAASRAEAGWAAYSSRRNTAATARSCGVVTLKARASPGTTTHGATCALDQRRRRRWPLPTGVGLLEHVPQEALWRLDRPQRRPVGGACTDAVLVDLLDGVDHRQAGHDRGVAGRAPPRTTASNSDGGARPGRRRGRARCRPRPGSARSPAATESVRSAPPATTSRRRGPGRCGPRWRRRRRGASCGATTTTWPTAGTASARLRACPSSGSPSSATNALGSAAPSRAPCPPATRTTATLRRRGPRRGWPRPCPRWSSRRARARRRGSGGPWRACASRRRTDHGPCRGATGRGRPRPP